MSTEEDFFAEQDPIILLTPEVTETDELRPPSVPPPRPRIRGEIVLPKWIYIRDRNGRYLTIRSTPENATLTFRTGETNLDCTFQADRLAYHWYQFFSRDRRKITIEGSNPGRYTTGGFGVSSFRITPIRENIICLQSFNPSRFFSNHLDRIGSPLARDSITLSAEMEIVQAAVKNEITNVRYDTSGAKVLNVAPLIALRTTVRNDSSVDMIQTLTYTYEKWSVGTWNSTAGIEIGAKTTFKAGVPFIASAKLEISVGASFSQQWGGESGIKQIITSSTAVNVPKKSSGRATVIIRNAQIDVSFLFSRTVTWSTGEITHEQNQRGIYTNVDSWDVDVDLDDVRPI